VLGNGRVLSVPAPAQMNGDALAVMENLDAAGGQSRLDLGAGEAVEDRIIMGVDVDVIVDAHPAHAPLAVFVRLVRQRVERRAIDLLEGLCQSNGRSSARGATRPPSSSSEPSRPESLTARAARASRASRSRRSAPS